MAVLRLVQAAGRGPVNHAGAGVRYFLLHR